MGQAFLHGNGGSNPLNLKVVTSTTAPANPKEYTIWVKSSVAVTSWEMGVSKNPTWKMKSGFVYLYTNTSAYNASTTFNPLKKNYIYLATSYVWQNQGTYDTPNWVRCEAYLYKAGVWVKIASTFAATIKVTYPSGSTLTCSDGTTTLKATTTTGSYTFTVPNTGTWTVKSVSGSNSASKSVSITSDGQSASVTLTYFDGYLFNYGSKNESITGGWKSDGGGTITTNSDGSIVAQPTTGYAQAIYHTVNKIDLTKYSTLTMNGIMWEYDGWYRTYICVWSNVTYGDYESGLVASVKGDANSAKDYTLDVSGLSGSYYVGIVAKDHPNYAKLTMNTMKLT